MYQRAFTVLEAIVVTALVGMIAFALGSIFIWQSIVYTREVARFDLDRAHNTTLERVERDIREARSVAVSKGIYATSSSTLVLALPIMASAPNPAFSDYVVYYRTGDTVYRKLIPDPMSKRPASDVALNPFIFDLTFAYNANPAQSSTSVTVNVISRRVIRAIPYSRTDLIAIALRNSSL